MQLSPYMGSLILSFLVPFLMAQVLSLKIGPCIADSIVSHYVHKEAQPLMVTMKEAVDQSVWQTPK